MADERVRRGEMMKFDHVGIVNRDRNEAFRFYHDLLGLDAIKESAVSPELSRKLFSIDQEIRMLVYGKGTLKVEVFILHGFTAPSPAVPHFGLQVRDLPDLLERVKGAGVKVISAERGGHIVHFIEDFCGNRFEVKQAE
jgi:catechol 2,3-dioxygenase-like lactoylglutathione lyase family enzyme